MTGAGNWCAPECLCEGNVVANFSADGIRGTRDGQTIQYNVIKNDFVGEKDGNHDGGIPVFLFHKGTGTLRNITLRGSLILGRETDGLPFPNPRQGIGCFDGPLVQVTVEQSVVWRRRLARHHARRCAGLHNSGECL